MSAIEEVPITMAPPASRATVLLIGGVNGMGRWLHEHLLRDEADVAVTVIDVAPPAEIPDRYAFQRIEYLDAEVKGLPDLSQFGWIIVATPPKQVAVVAERILANAAPGTLVTDVVSIKQQPLELIDRALPDGVGLIGTHPLFGLSVSSLVGQTVALCPTDRATPQDLIWLRDLLVTRGAYAPVMSAAEHDRAMAVVQVLIHSILWATVSTLHDTDTDMRRVLSLLTPPAHAFFGLLGKVADLQDETGARLYAEIQTAGYTTADVVRNTFLQNFKRFDKLAAASDDGLWRALAESAAEYFTRDALEAARPLFAQSPAAAQRDEVALYHHRRGRDVCAFRSITRGRVFAGRVRDYTRSAVTIDVCSTSKEREDGTRMYALGVDPKTQAAIAKLGFRVPTRRPMTLPRGEYKLLSSAEFEQWKRESLVPHQRDLTFSVPASVSGELVASRLPTLCADVLTSETISEYQPVDGSPRRWTARLMLRGDRLPDVVLGDLEELLSVFGVTIHGGGR